MKVIIAIDDSPYSQHVVKRVAARSWPENTQFKILSVIEPVCFDEFGQGRWQEVVSQVVEKERDMAERLCKQAADTLRANLPGARIHCDVREGNPRTQIVDAAVEWSADKVVLGAHGHNVCPRFIVGSVSKAVASHAPCSVEIIRAKETVR